MIAIDLSSFSIDKKNDKPIFVQVADYIQMCLRSGILKPGDKLPPERELSNKLGLARGTVKSAYKYLENSRIIETIRGSGSYIINTDNTYDFRKKKEAMQIISHTIKRLNALDLQQNEITNMFQLALSAQNSNRIVKIAIISNNHEALLDFRNQLSYLESVALSIFILETVVIDADPQSLLNDFEIIITPTQHYAQLTERIPDYKDRIIEAAASPYPKTIEELSALGKDVRIGIICRTNVFLQSVLETLISFNQQRENILSFFEADYTVKTYFPGGIHALISFSDAHIFTDEMFVPRNEELLRKGGMLIKFTYELERGTILYLEARIRQLLESTKEPM